MNVLEELHVVAAKLSPHDDRPTCDAEQGTFVEGADSQLELD
jgi:hypothetical protein